MDYIAVLFYTYVHVLQNAVVSGEYICILSHTIGITAFVATYVCQPRQRIQIYILF